ncbi:hypothetical protein Ae201684_000211 [Aphanomyces euteiches]|uniref:Ubiquitin-like domain-containing protein n=1 Tax=Aphanomyces euteiches TaxID=100861 RepID=A0A6G0XZ42_9STRA|nr:hypothetical protein Ae201684_000211 [Aphanomyces euteiches]KAH9157335.1 hypothetical protein AeRB84_000807 [Aphanomyces euteiches]
MARALTEAECEKVEALERKMKKLDNTIHLWVRDGNAARDGATPRECFSIKLRPALPISEIRDQIQERYEKNGWFNSNVDPPLRLLFGAKLLVDGYCLADYLPSHAKVTENDTSHPILKWVKPYAGIIWVIPIQIEPQYGKQWGGDCSTRT